MPNARSYADGWKGSRFKPKGSGGSSSQRTKFLVIAGIVLALMGAIAAWIYFLREPPRPHFVGIVIDQYEDPALPIVPWAKSDLNALPKLGWQSPGTFNSQQRNLLLQELEHLPENKNLDQPIVVYLRAYAVSTNNGVSILPADADLTDSKTWLPLRDVLQALGPEKCPFAQRLLLLDLAMPLIVPTAGIVVHDVADQVRLQLETNRKIDPTLQVLCACDPGQVSLASEEMGHTAFVYFLLRGLQGKADGALPNQGADRKVSVLELAEYTRERIDLWAWQNRRARQTPLFIGPRDVDYPLAYLGDEEPLADSALVQGYPEYLAKGWKLREKWHAKLGLERTAKELAPLDALLLRSESKYRAGLPTKEIEADFVPEFNRIQNGQGGGGDTTFRLRARSLVADRVWAPNPLTIDEDKRLRELKELARLHTAATKEKPNPRDVEEFTKAKNKFLDPFKEETEATKREELYWILYRVASLDNNPRRESFRLWLSLVREGGKPIPNVEEIRYLDRLANLTAKEEDWPALAIPEALRMFDEAMVARATPKRWIPWIQTLQQKAEEKRRASESQLETTTAANVREVLPMLRSAAEDYKTLNERVRILVEANRTLQEGLLFLPQYPPYLEAVLEDVPENKTDWMEAVQDTAKLRVLLEAPPSEAAMGSRLDEVRRTRGRLKDNIGYLQSPLRSEALKDLIQANPRGRVTDSIDMRNLLQLPGILSDQRKLLWKRWRTLAGKLHTQTMDRFEATGSSSKGEIPPVWNAEAGMAREYQLGLLRARVSLTLLELRGSDSIARVQEQLDSVSDSPTKILRWEKLRQELALAWSKLESD